MKNKLVLMIFTLVLVISILAGCSSANDSFEKDAALETSAYDSDDQTSARQEENNAAPEMDLGDFESSGKMIIYTARLDVKVDDATEAITNISASAAALGGYISDSSFGKNDDSAYGTVTVRIPPKNLGDLTEKIGTLGEVLSSSLTSDDVTFDYVDIQSRLSNAQAQESQLLAIMDKAVVIEDILAVRTELNAVQQEIEQYEGQLRYMENQVGYSTVTINISEVYIAKSPEVDENEGVIAKWSLTYIWENIAKGFTNSVAFTVNAIGFIFILISYLLIPGIIIVALLLLLLLIIRRFRRFKANRALKQNRLEEASKSDDTSSVSDHEKENAANKSPLDKKIK